MKKKLLVGTLIGAMMIAALVGCGKKEASTEETEKAVTEETTENETVEEAEAAKETEVTEEETEVVAEEPVEVETHVVDGLEITIPAEDNHYVEMMEDAATCTDAEIDQFIADVNTQLNKINSGNITAVDFNGDGTITNSEKFIVSIFTAGTTYEGIYTHYME